MSTEEFTVSDGALTLEDINNWMNESFQRTWRPDNMPTITGVDGADMNAPRMERTTTDVERLRMTFRSLGQDELWEGFNLAYRLLGIFEAFKREFPEIANHELIRQLELIIRNYERDNSNARRPEGRRADSPVLDDPENSRTARATEGVRNYGSPGAVARPSWQEHDISADPTRRVDTGEEVSAERVQHIREANSSSEVQGE